MPVFDREAQEYDQWYESTMGRFVDEVESKLAFSMLKPQKGMKVLDVGCGTGNFSIKLSKMGCDVVGVDLSREMLKIAKEKREKEKLDISFYMMDVYDLDFPDNAFDAVFSMATFEFIKEPERAYAEMYRVVKPGGRILIGTINKNSSWGRLYLSREFQENSVFQYADLKTREDMENLDQNHLVDAKECLFVPPDSEEEDFTMERERALSRKERGGFICLLYQKPEQPPVK